MSRILWADDEIDLLRPHILFLQAKGYDVTTVNSGADALDALHAANYDCALLDEHMPGLSGLDTLGRIRAEGIAIPVIMVTKSEDESLMDDALGQRIADYLIKPINPRQLLLSLKKILDGAELIEQGTSVSYRDEYAQLSDAINNASSMAQWAEVYRRLCRLDVELSRVNSAMKPLLDQQLTEARKLFGRYVRSAYQSFIESSDQAQTPIPSHRILAHEVFPMLDRRESVAIVVIDNFRYDQWLAIRDIITGQTGYNVAADEVATALLPTTTQYCRNSLFAGLLPADIARHYPSLWVDESSEQGKNNNEQQLLADYLRRTGRSDIAVSYHKLTVDSRIPDILAGQKDDVTLTAVVVNFIDMLSHSRTDSEILRRLVADEQAYRELTRTWMRHSPLLTLLNRWHRKGITVILTSDHGSVRVSRPVAVSGPKDTTSNPRYKRGRQLVYNKREVFATGRPQSVGLPEGPLGSEYIFAMGDDFLVYPNNQNIHVRRLEGSFQHGGCSPDEMFIPLITLLP